MLDDGRALALKLKADISPLLGDPDVDLQDESHWRRHTRQFYFRKALLPRIESPAKLSKLHPSSGNRRRCGRRPLGGRRPYQGCDLDGSKSPLEAASRCMDRSGPAYRFEKAPFEFTKSTLGSRPGYGRGAQDDPESFRV